MKKINLIFALLLSLMGVTQMKAEAGDYSVNFNGLTALPEGWEAVGTTVGFSYGEGTYEIGTDYARSGKGLYTYQTSYAGYIVTEAVTGDVSFYVRARAKNKACGVKVFKYDNGDVEEITAAAYSYTSSNTSTSWTQVTFSLTEGTRLAFQLNNAAIDDFVAEKYVQADGPALAVAGYKNGSSYSFVLVEPGTTNTFEMTNPGTEDVNVTISTEGYFTADPSSATIAAGGSETLTITVGELSGSGSVTITPDAEGLEPITINLNSLIKDPNKMLVDFADGNMPEGWTNVMIGEYGNGWTTAEGYAQHASSASSYYLAALTSPLLQFTEGETFMFEVSKYGTSTYSTSMLKLQKSADGTTWEDVYTVPEDQLVYGEWKPQIVSMPAGNYYVRFYGGYAKITNIYGGELPMIAIMKAEVEDYNFGFVSGTAEAKTFTIKNTGRADLTGLAAEITSGEGFEATVDNNSIAAGEQATLSVNLATTDPGLHEANVTVKADDQEDVTFKVVAYVADPEAILVDFAGNTIPEGWENSGFAVSNNEISTTYNRRTLTSPAITVSEGQKLVIYAKGGSTYSASLTVKSSNDNGATWNTAKEFTTELRENTTDYVILTVDDILPGNYLIQLEGYYVTINAINGYNYNENAPKLSVTPEEDAAFGTVTAAQTKTYTVENKGTGEMTVNIASDSEDFVVEPAQLVVTDEAKTFTVTFTPVEGNYGKFNANITVTPTYDETAAVSFAASATVKNPNVWDEDFEEGSLPTGWDSNNWTIGTFPSYENKTTMALAPSSSTAGTLITPPLEAKAGDVLNWEAYLNWYDEALIVEYSSDEKATWTEIYNYKTQDDTEAPSTSQKYYTKPMSFTAPADGIYYLRFTSTYQNGVDNFNGFKLALKEHDALITSQNIPATGNQYVEYTASVTLKELIGKDENVNIKFYLGENQVGETVESTIDPNGEETYEVTFTPEEAFEGEAHFVVTFVSDDDEVFATFNSDPVAVTIAAAPVLDETTGSLEGFENWTNYPVVSMKYSLKAGWNTIILPFAWSDLSVFGEGAKVYAFSDYSDADGISFTAATSLNAQTPYVLYATEAKSEITFMGVTQFRNSTEAADLQLSKSGATFQGTYAPVAAPDMEGKYGVVPSTGRIQKGSDKASMKGFRGYFTLPASAPANVVATFFEADGTVTAIKDVRVLDVENGDIFDLSGRKVTGTAKAGVYIQNGKKIVVK